MKQPLSKRDILSILMLLSALESWGLSSKTEMPEYLKKHISDLCKLLGKVLLDEES